MNIESHKTTPHSPNRGSPPGDATPPFAAAVILLAVAGWVDGVGFLQFGHLFVSFMSGNSTQMAVSFGNADWVGAGVIATFIALFVVGVFLGTLAANALGKWHLPAVLVAEVLLLLLGLLLPATESQLPAAAFPVVLAMGWQNAALQRVGNKKISLTYVTGTLVNIGRGLAEAVSGYGPRWAWAADLLLWGGMVTGAVIGAACYVRIGFFSLVIPIVVTTLLAGEETWALLTGRR